ncbi:conserved hypothetical protein [Methylocella silvestris BL2]|uniref:Anti-sigma factor NepR domain-containing protein n=1 Tax=Methylocella silvestris (strain DSM 15510 / CIP 108128 / LMG 27833 / NCIMB 13906 / BL2) TaxID=395965 RepID=B8EP26_METSB|nr:NepR family anti-sigma factor [Methylocella silvestris]ACK49264.1 conserved hypothetical protein [Methylocella silvestris BL2]
MTKLTKAGVGARNGEESAGEDIKPEIEAISYGVCAPGRVVPVKARAPAKMADQIGVSLRSVYNDVLSQPVPDRFFDLLRELESAGGAQFKKGAP